MKKSLKIVIFIVFLLVLDQTVKVLVKTNLNLYESIRVLNWFEICFTENPGMAFGITFGSKTVLTIFRLIISGLVLFYIIKLIQNNYKTNYLLCISLIFAGAIGNIIDCLFYGIIFSESTPYQMAVLFPVEGGYGTFLHGKVVDMFYFPIFTFPSWVPFWGGEIFFSPIFNVADISITLGITILILFFRKDFDYTFDAYFSKNKKKITAESK
jgi:signal peptidase II